MSQHPTIFINPLCTVFSNYIQLWTNPLEMYDTDRDRTELIFIEVSHFKSTVLEKFVEMQTEFKCKLNGNSTEIWKMHGKSLR